MNTSRGRRRTVDTGECPRSHFLQTDRGLSAVRRALGYRLTEETSINARIPHNGLTTGGITQIAFAAAGRAGLGPMHSHHALDRGGVLGVFERGLSPVGRYPQQAGGG